MSKPRQILPDTARPSKYTLRLQPDLEKALFKGEEVVQLKINRATNRIVLHAAELKLSNVTLKQATSSLAPKEISYDEPTETVNLDFENELTPGDATLSLHFDGILNNKMKGFYSSKYTVEGKEKTMAVTQFEPADARRAFPCWDEPELKAVFDITLQIPDQPKLVAVSNMPAKSEKTENGLRIVEFSSTPIMPTYLVAFVVGEFDYLETKDRDGVVIRVYTPVGKKASGQFALDVAAKTLPYYNDYFGVPYPLPKMDMLAIPDFAAGAMENWGCVTYRETALLVDPDSSSSQTKQWVALVVGHELAHQWFGNIVTMSWWTDLWLNEGFATWIEYLCVSHCFPEWDIWTQFVYADQGRALQLDGLKNSHPVEVEVSEVAEIDEIFDAISYSKGCSVIRMLSSYIGESQFREGLRNYLKKHSYANATTNDLWDALEQVSGKPIRQLMDSWTRKTGYPVVSISLENSGENSSKFKLQQKRFFASEPVEDSTKWLVPINYITKTTPQPSEYIIFSDPETTVDVPVKAGDWIKFNSEQASFFRTLYSSELLEGLGKALDAQEIVSASDRIGIESDAFALARSGFLGTEQVLKLVASYKKEKNYTVWADLSSNLNGLESLIDQLDCYENFKRFGRDLYSAIFEEVGWDKKDGEPLPLSMLRTLVLTKLARFEDERVVKEAQERFNTNPKSIVADLRGMIYRIVLARGGEKEYEEILKFAEETDLNEEKLRCYGSLGSTRKPELLKRTLDLAFSEKIRSQDCVSVFASVAANPRGKQMAWDYLRENWERVSGPLKSGFLIYRLITCAVQDFSSEEKAVQVEEFFKTNPLPTDRPVKQAVETIRSNARWIDRDRAKIEAWFREHFSN